MKKTYLRTIYFGFSVLILMLIGFSCEKNSLFSGDPQLTGDQEEDLAVLVKIRNEIDSLSNLHSCNNPAEWKFTAIGSKACGGPTGYVAYSNKLDVKSFLKKVDTFTRLNEAYNKKWKIASDCMYLTPPDRIVCQDGKPKLVWSNVF